MLYHSQKEPTGMHEIGKKLHQAAWETVSKKRRDFPGGTVVKNPPANAGDMGSSPGLGRSHMLRSN